MVGIDARNQNILDQKYICPVCALIIRDPVQFIGCGHRQCQTCLGNEDQRETTCPQCQTKMLRTEVFLDRGFQNEMKTLLIVCSWCQWDGILYNYQKHLDESHPNLTCEYCSEQFSSTNKFNEHKVSACQKISVECSSHDSRCNESIIRGEMENHSMTEQHQRAVINDVRRISYHGNDRRIDTDCPRTTTESYNPDTSQFEALHGILNIFAGGIKALGNDGQRLNNQSLQAQITLQRLAEKLPGLKLSMEESNGFLQGVNCNLDILKQDFTSLQEKVNDLQCVSYDGTFIWKITNVKEKMMDAQSERQTSIYSPPFYSSSNGYKMRARLYLNGDGNARRTHMSMFFVLMRSLNDQILKFPFNYKVTFCLFDQTSAQRHIIDSFRPDIKSSSFQRPRTDMNIASGIPKFFPLEMIQQEGNPYVRDDTMFIKILVDFGDTPKTLLPYVLSLNPGLPTHVQQTLIKREVERREQQQSDKQLQPPKE
ncbi:unnamed protein product [Rotaria magnacalcarata]|uniref:RING-type domain-containing protein n=5 Tax=Rotaria magnacalcarata TaxID=392030 RepID=A0A814WZQ0_9BILA|nr:unnamed protein product [Rotaria magnacalcarata]